MRRGRSTTGRVRSRSGRGRFGLLYGRAALHAGALSISGAATPADSSASLDPAHLTSAMLEIWPNQPHHELSTDFYSLFLETEINFGGEGGLLADQVWNGDFEALGRGDWSQPSEAQAAANPGSGRAAAMGCRTSACIAASLNVAEPPPDPSTSGRGAVWVAPRRGGARGQRCKPTALRARRP